VEEARRRRREPDPDVAHRQLTPEEGPAAAAIHRAGPGPRRASGG
jgi:hypothetical protein